MKKAKELSKKSDYSPGCWWMLKKNLCVNCERKILPNEDVFLIGKTKASEGIAVGHGDSIEFIASTKGEFMLYYCKKCFISMTGEIYT